MVLAGDEHLARLQVLDRVVGAVVAELHLHRLRARGEPEQLVPEADAEGGNARAHDLADRLDRVLARLRIPGAIGEEHAVGLERHRFLRAGGGREHRHLAAALGEVPQDVVLHAVVVGDDAQARFARRLVAGVQRPEAAVPVVGLVDAHDPGEVLARHRGRGLRRGERLVDPAGRVGSRDDAAVLRALRAQVAREPPRVDVADGDQGVAREVGGEVLLPAPARSHQGQVADDEARGVDLARLDVFRVGPGVADVRVGERDDLAGVGGIGEDLLVTRHRGVEDHLSDRLAVGSDAAPAKNTPVGENQDGGGLLRHGNGSENGWKTAGAKKRESATAFAGSSRFHQLEIIAETPSISALARSHDG
jgi:hypothetical protein